MPMLEPKELEERRMRRLQARKRKRRSYGMLPLIVLFIILYVAAVSVMPMAALKTQAIPLSQNISTKSPSVLPWPTYGQAALGAVGYGLLTQHGDQKPIPMASVAKVITALAVLKERPIYTGQPIPVLTITAQDVATYKKYAAEDQSVVAVEAGEQLSEYQALQALLLPSANNMADVLVRWAFESNQNYLQFANPFTATLGMKNTHIADASGFSPETVSTAVDLTKLAEIAMNNPIIAEIVNQPQADLPVAGMVYNINKLVGHDGIVGIKTGNTDEAGGCYLFSVRRPVNKDRQITLVGTIMGAENLSTAIDDALPLIESAFKLFHESDIVHNSQIVGKIHQTGGVSASVVTKQGQSVVIWDNINPRTQVFINTLGSSVRQGDEIGRLEIKAGDMAYTLPLVASDTINPPSLAWRIRHAAGYL